MSSLYDAAIYDTDVYYGAVGSALVELLINGVWTDVTGFVRIEDGIRIERGVKDWQQAPTYATCTMTLDNRDGRFSPRNASGAYYGYIGRNTQLRVSVYLDDGSSTVRFWGDVSEWPVSWDLSGRNIETQIVACGIRRSLGKLTVTPPFSRTLISTAGAYLVGYWPMEDGALAASFGSGLPGGAPGTFTSTAAPDLAADDTTFLASAALPQFGDGDSATFPVPVYTPDSTGQQVRTLVKITGASGGFIWRVDTVGAHYFLFEYAPATNALQWVMKNYLSGVTEYTSTLYGPVDPFTTGVRFGMFFKQNGTGIDVQWTAIGPGSNLGHFAPETVPLSTFGYITGVTLYTDPVNGTTATVGHLSVESRATSVFDLRYVLDDFAGDNASQRATRLAGEQSAAIVTSGTAANTALMGPQQTGAFLDVLDMCAYTDDGLSTEDVTTRALRFRGRQEMYDLTPSPSFTYSSGLLEELVPVDDDKNLANDVTVQRIMGGSARAVDTTSAVSTSAVGTYAVEYDLNLFTDSQCADQAGWRLAEGTVNKPRLASMVFDAYNQTAPKRLDIVAMREGDTVGILSPPAYTGLDTTLATQRVLGWTETIGYRSWLFELNCVDTGPFKQVFILNDSIYGVLNTDRLGF